MDANVLTSIPGIITESIVTGVAGLMFTCIILLYKKSEKNQNTLLRSVERSNQSLLQEFKAINKATAEELKNLHESIVLTDDRVDVFDRLLSSVADKRFNSKLVAQDRRPEPSMDHLKAVVDSHRTKGLA